MATKVVRSQRNHRCVECRGIIKAGEEHFYNLFRREHYHLSQCIKYKEGKVNVEKV